MNGSETDPRMLEILRLVRELAAAEAPASGRTSAPLAPPTATISADRRAEHLLTSATDLLVPWGPDPPPTAGSSLPTPAASRWDDYLGGGAPPVAPPAVPTSGAGAAPIRLPATALAEPARDAAGDVVQDEAAEAVIDSLFDFLHALERRDVDGAMLHVAADFHSLRGHREIDRDGLRLELDRFLDEHQGGALSLRLSRVPEPVAHPLGVLVWAPLQVDFVADADEHEHEDEGNDEGGERRSWLDERLALFVEGRDGGWRLGALATVGERG